ncbi:hypothetical protein Hypma_003413 [Hypsizygus marmoreus]|uniref:Uncharacterized protein n=1 Tax=Hypsizygus marmoreus TaxID=39966 RepID=A0A369J284_HYPMA|nr:hypothetical protein Hypma_003413 [Hypsizygus marmoreus]
MSSPMHTDELGTQWVLSPSEPAVARCPTLVAMNGTDDIKMVQSKTCQSGPISDPVRQNLNDIRRQLFPAAVLFRKSHYDTFFGWKSASSLCSPRPSAACELPGLKWRNALIRGKQKYFDSNLYLRKSCVLAGAPSKKHQTDMDQGYLDIAAYNGLARQIQHPATFNITLRTRRQMVNVRTAET